MSAAVVGAALWSSLPALAASAPAGYKSFTSQQNHYQIAYPASWLAKANKAGQQFFYGTRVAGFRTNVNVYIVPGVKPVPLSKLGPAVAAADRKAGATVSSVGS